MAPKHHPARLAEAGKPLPGAVQQLRRTRAGVPNETKKEGRRLVRPRRRSAVVRVRGDLDRVQGRPRDEIQAGPRPSPGLRLPDDGAERRRRADPTQGPGGGTVKRSKRKAERQPCTQFVHRMPIRESMPQRDVETETVANLPNETDQRGYHVELAKCLFDEKLGNRPHRPFRGSLDNRIQKQIRMMIAGRRRHRDRRIE
jgi:hypothetical protein